MAEEVTLAMAGNAVRRLRRDMGQIPKDLQRRLRPAMRAGGQDLLADARRRASWSTRIPAAMRLATSFTRRQAGVSLVVSRHRAPHARPYEGIRGNDSFRRPVFGNRERWVETQTRPFAGPAVDLHGPRVVAAVNRVVDEAAVAAGFTRKGMS
ncbi:HK97 gp10 family phage protein [Nocardiopsis dassonvillei]|uniref:HK97 gp10 family phage protein n=1 Tax=Nocardiopsis dassonvillei TaxID=2014 RepID=UPI00362A6FD4